jgi:hypothetical protein
LCKVERERAHVSKLILGHSFLLSLEEKFPTGCAVRRRPFAPTREARSRNANINPGPDSRPVYSHAGNLYSHPRNANPHPLEYARRSSGGDLCSNRTAISLDFCRPTADKNFALKRVLPFYIPSYARSPLRGFPAPSGTRSSASHCAPLWGLGSSQNKFAKCSKERSANFS